MDLEFVGKRIEGVLTILPENEYIFEDEVLNPQDAKAKRLKRIIGFGKRRRVKGDTMKIKMSYLTHQFTWKVKKTILLLKYPYNIQIHTAATC